ncbi:E3 ubiquitin/ISG15 ligase TRIM25-like [Spea bombifrons]|uniref:E3 ubiquitin/ISG15 ligase TRIM25-like n=1 Tax=Spea bombifrons TaxID=233779 RepID=UPI00234B2198|nr:E3 ubiquitin/ISG15 ligase TRIM25-like [Spea bombifrons]
MESAGLRDELNCPVCLDVYTDPVMLTCGHNFCRGCIRTVLDSQERCGLYSCPECRTEYPERPALQRNRTLGNIAERFLFTRPGREQATVFCTYCVHASVPASKTCLQCETSLCDVHLDLHNKSVEHVLVEPTASLKDMKCSAHKEVLKYYCAEDSTPICASCSLAKEHRGHVVEPLNETVSKRKDKLRLVLETLTSKREKTENECQSLQGHQKKLQQKSTRLTQRVSDLFEDLRKQLEDLERKVRGEISMREKEGSLQIFDLLQKLEANKEELVKKIQHIEELCRSSDPFTVLQGWKLYSGDYLKAEEEEDNEDQESLHQNICAAGDLDEGLLSATIHTALVDIVTKTKKGPCVAEVSDVSGNVAGGEKLISVSSGQQYWEVEASETGIWRIGLTYPNLDNEDDQSNLGDDKKSWCLYMFDKDYSVIHNSKQKPLHPDSPVTRLGMYLDYEAGRLSFYQICDPIRHLHTFMATFTKPLHAAFRVHVGGWLRIRSQMTLI